MFDFFLFNSQLPSSSLPSCTLQDCGNFALICHCPQISLMARLQLAETSKAPLRQPRAVLPTPLSNCGDTMGGQERREGKSQRCAEVLAEMTWLDFAAVREQGLPLGLIFQDESVCLSAQEICSSLQIRVIRSSSLLKNFQWLLAAKRSSSQCS